MPWGGKRSKMILQTRKGFLSLALGALFSIFALAAPLPADTVLAVVAFVLGIMGIIFCILGRKAFGRDHSNTVVLGVVLLASILGGLVTIAVLLLTDPPFLGSLQGGGSPLAAAAVGLVALQGLPFFLLVYGLAGRGTRALAGAALVLSALVALLPLVRTGAIDTANYAKVSSSGELPSVTLPLLDEYLGAILLIGLLWTIAFFGTFRRVATGEALLRRSNLAPVRQGVQPPSGLECNTCHTPLPVAAALCPACGADPWLTHPSAPEPTSP